MDGLPKGIADKVWMQKPEAKCARLQLLRFLGRLLKVSSRKSQVAGRLFTRASSQGAVNGLRLLIASMRLASWNEGFGTADSVIKICNKTAWAEFQAADFVCRRGHGLVAGSSGRNENRSRPNSASRQAEIRGASRTLVAKLGLRGFG